MLTHSTYSTQNPLPSRPSGTIFEQIDAYINQQEWYPDADRKYARRDSADDLRKHKCKARYKAQFANGPVSSDDIRKKFKIQRQSVNLKLREYQAAGFIRLDETTKLWEWIEDAAE